MLRVILDKVDFFLFLHRHSIINFSVVPLGMGIGLYFWLDYQPSIYYSLAYFLSSAFLCFTSTRCKQILYGFLLFSFGFFIANLRTILLSTPMLDQQINKTAKFTATIIECEKSKSGLEFLVNNVKFRNIQSEQEFVKSCNNSKTLEKFNSPPTTKHYTEPIDENYLQNLQKLNTFWEFPYSSKKSVSKIKLLWKNFANCMPIDFPPSSQVSFLAKLTPIYKQAFPGAYDFRKQAFFGNISCRGYIVAKPIILKKQNKLFWQTIRQKINHRIYQHLNIFDNQPDKNKEIAGVISALITGNKIGITPKIRTIFADSGIAHVLAISGLHMSIIGVFIFAILRFLLSLIPWISLQYDTKKISAVISLLFGLIYLQISGCSVPSIRATIMHAMITISIMLNRQAISIRSVCFAAILILTITPEEIMFPSFQMSFAAVITIVALHQNIRLNKLSSMLLTTVTASLATSVFSIFTFGKLTLNAIFSNLLVIPLMAIFIMPIALFVIVSIPFASESFFIKLLGFFTNIMIEIAKQVATWPYSSITMKMPTISAVLLITTGLLWMSLTMTKSKLYGLIPILAGILNYFYSPQSLIFVSPHAKLVAINMGDCVCVNTFRSFKSDATLWTKSLGLNSKIHFDEISPSKIQKIDKYNYVAHLPEMNVLIANNQKIPQQHYNKFDIVIDLNKSTNSNAIIFFDKNTFSNCHSTQRPWS